MLAGSLLSELCLPNWRLRKAEVQLNLCVTQSSKASWGRKPGEKQNGWLHCQHEAVPLSNGSSGLPGHPSPLGDVSQCV